MSPETEPIQPSQTIPSPEEVDSLMLKYEERKALVKTPDAELVELGKKESHSFKNPTDNLLTSPMFWTKDILDEHLEGKRLIELGSGKWGVSRGIKFMSPKEDVFAHDFGISEFVAVDLFTDPKEVWEEAEGSLRYVDEERREVIRNKLTFEQKDMFGYLLEQPDNSANVMMSSVDYALIQSGKYHRRVAQEIFRIVPEDGVFVVNNCPEIEDEAKELFPFVVSFKEANTRCYSKKEILPQFVADTHSYDLYKFLCTSAENGELLTRGRFVELLSKYHVDTGKYFEKCGFKVDPDQLWLGEGDYKTLAEKVPISKK